MASEREFKSASLLSNGNRTRLLPNNLRKLLFLKHNLKAVGFNSINLKCPERNVDAENQQIIDIIDEDEGSGTNGSDSDEY